MHSEAQASGLPFPPLLRKELFDARGLPEWYCPVRRWRLLPASVLVCGSVIAMTALLYMAFALTHSRRLELAAYALPRNQACAGAQASCSALLSLQAPLPAHAELKAGDWIEINASGAPSLQVRIVDVSPGTSASTPSLRVAWSDTSRLATGKVTIIKKETKRLIGWVAPRIIASQVAGPRS